MSDNNIKENETIEEVNVDNEVAISNKDNLIKKSFQSKKFKSGAYSTLVTIVAIIIVIMANLFADELDLKFDLSSEKIFTLSDQTKEILSNLKDDVTIYQIVTSGNEDVSCMEVINKYSTQSGKINIIQKDPVVYPTFTDKYLGTGETITENSFIVECGNRYKVVLYKDMFVQEINMSTYEYEVTEIDIEGRITQAIMYVTSKNLPVMYEIGGHGEVALSEKVTGLISKENVELKQLNLMTGGSIIPEEAKSLIINAPMRDYTTEEVDAIIKYLESGGKILLLTTYTNNDMTNFNSLLEYLGVKLVDGVVIEGNSSYYLPDSQAYLVPKIEVHEITTPIKSSGLGIIVPLSKGIEILDSKRETVDIISLLDTSSEAYSKVDSTSSTIEKADEDILGPFNLAVAIKETYGENEARVVILGSSMILQDELLTYSSAGNSDLFLNSVSWLNDQESSISIRTRSVKNELLSLTGADVNLWSIITILVIPVIFLITGIVVWLRRRKK